MALHHRRIPRSIVGAIIVRVQFQRALRQVLQLRRRLCLRASARIIMLDPWSSSAAPKSGPPRIAANEPEQNVARHHARAQNNRPQTRCDQLLAMRNLDSHRLERNIRSMMLLRAGKACAATAERLARPSRFRHQSNQLSRQSRLTNSPAFTFNLALFSASCNNSRQPLPPAPSCVLLQENASRWMSRIIYLRP